MSHAYTCVIRSAQEHSLSTDVFANRTDSTDVFNTECGIITGDVMCLGGGGASSRLGEEADKHWESLLHQPYSETHSMGEWNCTVDEREEGRKRSYRKGLI